jgi:hypothetical protein
MNDIYIVRGIACLRERTGRKNKAEARSFVDKAKERYVTVNNYSMRRSVKHPKSHRDICTETGPFRSSTNGKWKTVVAVVCRAVFAQGFFQRAPLHLYTIPEVFILLFVASLSLLNEG